MYSGNDNSFKRGAFEQPLAVEWLEAFEVWPMPFVSMRKNTERRQVRPAQPWACAPRPCATRPRPRAFTILEMMIVIGIIGLMAAVALPHLSGFTQGNSMTGATRQMLDDVGLARQRAIANRSEVCMVFLPPNFWLNDQGPSGINFSNSQVGSLAGHQYAAYALISMRTVGDQPGISNAHYLTDWRYLPQGVYIYPWQLTNNVTLVGTNFINTTNITVTGNSPPIVVINQWPVTPFSTNITFPFPYTYLANSNNLPYIGFLPSGQLVAGSDQFIGLSAGSIFTTLDASGNPDLALNNASLTETPMGNVSNNANLIHIDWVTGRAKLERNSF